MHDHLVVHELVALGEHHEAVQREELSERVGLENLDVLIRTPSAVEHILDSERNAGPILPVLRVGEVVKLLLVHSAATKKNAWLASRLVRTTRSCSGCM